MCVTRRACDADGGCLDPSCNPGGRGCALVHDEGYPADCNVEYALARSLKDAHAPSLGCGCCCGPDQTRAPYLNAAHASSPDCGCHGGLGQTGSLDDARASSLGCECCCDPGQTRAHAKVDGVVTAQTVKVYASEMKIARENRAAESDS